MVLDMSWYEFLHSFTLKTNVTLTPRFSSPDTYLNVLISNSYAYFCKLPVIAHTGETVHRSRNFDTYLGRS